MIHHPYLFPKILPIYVVNNVNTDEVFLSDLFMLMRNDLPVMVAIFTLFSSTLTWPFFRRYDLIFLRTASISLFDYLTPICDFGNVFATVNFILSST